jgi:hypothetical protein
MTLGPNPPRLGSADGLGADVSLAADLPEIPPKTRPSQTQNFRRFGARPQLRVVASNPRARLRRIELHISVRDGPAPIGRTRPIKLTEAGAERVLDLALALEAEGA